MPRIDIAEEPGVGLDGVPRPTEDVVVVTDNAVAVLDGATEQHPDLPSGGWYAHRLATRLEVRLTGQPQADLAALLAAAITDLVADHGLTPRRCPSSTVAMLRWTDDRIDALVLADSPIVAFGRSRIDVLADERLKNLQAQGELGSVAAADRLRNTDGGFWVAEADPSAADHALRRSWAADDVDTVLLATDGVTVGVDTYRLFDWRGAHRLAREWGARAVVDAVDEAERADPSRTRWPRGKAHDDKALVVLDFRDDAEGPAGGD